MDREVERRRVKPGDAQKLVDDAVHARGICAQFFHLDRVVQFVEPGGQDRQGRAQFMGGVGGKLPLHDEALLHSVEREVDRADQRQQLGRQLLDGKSNLGHPRLDQGSPFRGRSNGSQSSANADEAHHKRRDREESENPGDNSRPAPQRALANLGRPVGCATTIDSGPAALATVMTTAE